MKCPWLCKFNRFFCALWRRGPAQFSIFSSSEESASNYSALLISDTWKSSKSAHSQTAAKGLMMYKWRPIILQRLFFFSRLCCQASQKRCKDETAPINIGIDENVQRCFSTYHRSKTRVRGVLLFWISTKQRHFVRCGKKAGKRPIEVESGDCSAYSRTTSATCTSFIQTTSCLRLLSQPGQ